MPARHSIPPNPSSFAVRGLWVLAGLMLLCGGVAKAAMIGSGLGPHSVAIADLNEDGWADLVSGNLTDSTLAVSLGRGNGTFDPKVQYACGAPVSSIAVADLDNDGHLDVISCCQSSNTVGVRYGAGNGTLGARTDLVATGPTDLAIGDFDENSNPDIAFSNWTGNSIGFLRSVGVRAFGAAQYVTGPGATRLALGDLNNDNHLDVVSTELIGNGFSVWLGSGVATFTGPTHFAMNDIASDVALADFNSDGKLDVAGTIPNNSAVNWRLGNGDGTFGINSSISTGAGGNSLVSADFNGDNAPDLAVSASDLNLASVLIGNGNGTFQPRVQYFGGMSCDGIAVGQLDGSPGLDLALAAPPQNSICTVPGNGDGTFQSVVGNVYVWGYSTSPGSFNDPNAWRPARSVAHPTDILWFNRGGQFGVLGVSGTVGQITVSGGSQAAFSASGFGTSSVTVAGGSGTDLVVERSSVLNLTSFVSPVQVGIAAGANAQIDGDVWLAATNNRLQAQSSSGIIFQSTGRAFIEPSSTSATTPFGDGTGASGLNSVRFLFGSQCIMDTPATVFGTAAPNAVVVFGPGSRYKQNVAFNPDVSGRTYGDFEYNASNTGSVMSGSGPFQVDSLIVTAGTLTSTLTGTVTIRGNVHTSCALTPGPPVDYAAKLNFLPASPMTIRLAGSARQYMRPGFNCGRTVFYLNSNVTLNIDNPAGIEFFHGFHTSANLSFTHGTISTHAIIDESLPVHRLIRYRVEIDSTATVTGAGPSTGWFACPLMRRVTADGTIRMDVGDSLSYQPVDLTLHGVSSPGDILAATANEDHWEVASAQLDMAHLAHRSWSLWAANVNGSPATYLSSVDAVLPFATSDLSPGADPLQFEIRKWFYDQGWSSATTGARTPTSIEVLGLPASVIGFTPNFQIGQPITPSMSISNASGAEGNGTVSSRIQPMQAQSAGSLSFRVRLSQAAIAPISVHYQTVDGTATVADGDYTPVNGTLNFAPGDTALDIVVPFGTDATPERNETFGVTLSNATGDVTVSGGTATGTILDDDDLVAPTATVVYPNGGEFILQNQQVNLQWTASDNVAVSGVDIQIVNGASVTTLASNHPNTGSYLWNATGPASTKMKFRVVAHDDPGHVTTDNSNANWELSASAVGVDGDLPVAFALPQPSPNPAPAGRNRIAFALPHEADVKLTVHDIQGRTLATLANGIVPAGRHDRIWDCTQAAAGIYFIRFQAPGFHAERRLVVVR